VIERALAEQAIAPDTLTLGTDNGSTDTARQTKTVIRAQSRPSPRWLPRAPLITATHNLLKLHKHRLAAQGA
jgi:hypothetical protein